MILIPSVLAFCTLASGLTTPSAADIDQAVATFRRLRSKEQKLVLARVRAAVEAVRDPYLHSLRESIARAKNKARSRTKSMRPKGNPKLAVGGDPPLARGLAFPVHNQYLFGRGQLAVVEASRRANSRAKKGRKRRRVKFPMAASGEESLRAMLSGYLPELDLAVAAILKQLDTEHSADRFAVFLDSWRNGSESFYRALDRTAGTQQSLFFYDAMLSDYIKLFVPKKHADYQKLRRSLKEAHDALHESFLAYRQYRGLREAVAFALVLSDEHKLPGPLARYEKAHAKKATYSLRQQIALLMSAFDQDLERVAELVVKATEPLHPHLWTKPYDPWSAFNKAFDAEVSRMLDGKSTNTDKLLAVQLAFRKKSRESVSAAAWGAFQEAAPAR